MASILNDNHWRNPQYRQRITRKELKQILLDNDDCPFIAGRQCTMKKKYLGAGIYEIWFVTREYVS